MQSKDKNIGSSQFRNRWEQYCKAKGYSPKTGEREVLFEQTNSGQDINKIIDTGHEATNVYGIDGVATTQKALGGGQGAKTGLYAIRCKGWNGDYEGVKKEIFSTVGTTVGNKTLGSGRPLVGESRRSQIAVPMRWSRTEEGKRARKEAMKNGKDYTPFSGGARTLTESKEDVSGCLTNALNKDALLKHDMRIRRLTPTECERLMGLEDGERCGIIRLWQQETKNFPTSKISANAGGLNGEVVKPVGSAGRTESQENVPSAKKSSLSKSLKPKELVVLNVQVNSEKNSIKIWQNNNEEELLLDVSGVEKKGKFPNHNQIEDFVQMVVGLNTILWRETHNGKAESRVREQFLILQKNGVPVLNMYGINTMPPVRDVGKDLTTLSQHLKSIISLDSKIKNYEQNIQTLFFSAIPVITGFIPIKIEIENISEIKLSVLSGWTAKGIIDGKEVDISDTQRYKMCGNGVVVNCVDYIYSLLFNETNTR